MQRLLLNLTHFLSIFLFLATMASAQVISTELIEHYNIEDVYTAVSELGVPDDYIPVIYEVDFYRITYMTLHPNGNMVEVSGALAVPQSGQCEMPISSYQHGTIARKTDAPSFQSAEGELCVLYASAGYVAAAADYIGLGTGEGLHLYVHAESEANACLDLLRATVELQDELGFVWNEELFLWGYSQGGHATAALQRKIELEASEEFTITASAPMSGPYDVSGIQAEVLVADEPYPTPGYLPYVVLSYQEAYGNIYNDINEVFLPEYAAILPDLFDGTNSMGAINNACPDIPNQMLQPDFLEAYMTDPDHPMRVALADNDLYDWAPQVPTMLVYCNADDQVNYQNSLVALEAFEQLGSDQVTAIDMGAFNHSFCAPFAMFEGFNWFEEMREQPFIVEAYGTESPATELGGGADGSIDVFVDASQNYSFEWSNSAEELDQTGLSPGDYTLTLTSDLGCMAVLEFEIDFITSISELSDAGISIYPNPATDRCVVEAIGTHPFSVVDMQGRIFLQDSFTDRLELNTAEWSKGMYVIVLDGGSRGYVLKL